MSHILFVIPSMAMVGGAEKLVTTLSSLLQDNHKISITSFDPIGTAPAFPLPCNFYPLGQSIKLPLLLRFISYLHTAKELFKLKRRLSPSISISLLWRADLVNALTKRKCEKIASLIVINIVNNPTNALLYHLKLIAGWIYRRFDKVLAITPTISREIQSLYRIKSNRISVFRTFVEHQNIPAELAASNRRRFVFCGRLVHEKNIEGLLHVFKLFSSKHKKRQLLIIGDGPLLLSMITLAKSLGLSVSRIADTEAQVVFVGSIKDPEIYMQGASAFLLPSKHEGLPTVLIQAAALSLPILAADCHGGGVQYLLNECLSAAYPLNKSRDLLLPIPDSLNPATLDAWVRAMELIDSDKVFHHSMTELSSKISQNYSRESVKAAWLKLISAIADQ